MNEPVRLHQLLSLEFDPLLVGDGEFVVHGAKERLQELIDTFPR